MPLPTVKDPVTGVPVSRVSSGQGIHLLPYYTANCIDANNQYVCCTRHIEGISQAWIYSLEDQDGDEISQLKDGVLDESVAFHPSKPLLFYGSSDAVYRYDMQTHKTETVFKCNPGFKVKSEISCGEDFVIFWIYEVVLPRDMSGMQGSEADYGYGIGNFHLLRNCKSYILASHIETGAVHAVWGDTAPLTHPVINPADNNTVLFANQGTRELWQELFTIPIKLRDNAKPRKLYTCSEQRPVYVGHSFFTFDGKVGTQLLEFGGADHDGVLSDLVGYNAIINPDGSCDRRARCPGGNRPLHCHSAYSDSWWVGDTYPKEGGPVESNMLCIMKNNWETGFCQAEPLAVHGCNHRRPCHVHPRFSKDEKMVLFNSNYKGDCQVYIVHMEEYLDNWRDAASFAPREYRHGMPPFRNSETGPEA